MFLAGSDGIRLAGLECRISRVSVGLIKLETKPNRENHLTSVSGAASMFNHQHMGVTRKLSEQSGGSEKREHLNE